MAGGRHTAGPPGRRRPAAGIPLSRSAQNRTSDGPRRPCAWRTQTSLPQRTGGRTGGQADDDISGHRSRSRSLKTTDRNLSRSSVLALPTICGSQRSDGGSASSTDRRDVCAVGWRWAAWASYVHLGPGMAALGRPSQRTPSVADQDGAGAGNPWLPSIQAVAAALVVRAMGQAGCRLVSASKRGPAPCSSASARPCGAWTGLQSGRG